MKKILFTLLLFFPILLMAQTNIEDKKAKSVTEPLYVVNGKILSSTNVVKDSTQAIISIGAIDPHDIESINVLKDKSATDKYGGAGKNGVIIITTVAYAKKSKKQ